MAFGKPATVRTYLQDRPKDYIRENPQERWRCDIYPDDGSDHHGVGSTEAEAIWNAACAYMRWIGREDEL